jgi:hypothetical protein
VEKSAGKSDGELRVPKHGRGRLRTGSKPGNTAGPGRPPSVLRERMRGALEARIAIAEQIADDKKASHTDRLRALDFLAKYGMGTTVTETDSQGNDVPRGRLTDAERRALLLEELGKG